MPGHRLRRNRKRIRNKRRRETPLLSRVQWEHVEKTVIREQRNRETYTPVVSVYRWWARRPHALMGAVLDAAIQTNGNENLVVSDPFSGGGTVAVEAARRGLPVYAQDLYPWPTNGLAVSLSNASPERFAELATDLLRALEPLRFVFRRPDGRELSHVLRVRVGICLGCREDVYLFPNPMFSLASRGANEKRGLFGCRACGNVTPGPRDKSGVPCSACGYDPKDAESKPGLFACPHCNHAGRAMDFAGARCAWKPIAVQEVVMVNGRRQAMMRIPDEHDPVDAPIASLSFPYLAQNIPDGVETHRLLCAGFRAWGDLYTDRQANVLLAALRWIEEVDAPPAYKDRLALAVIGAAETPSFLSRWDRHYLKVYEGIANHRYAHTTLVVESNPLAQMGRGTLPHRLNSARKALEWVVAQTGPRLKTNILKQSSRRTTPDQGVVISTGSSIRQRLKDGVVDLVLTDPPYYDDVQYGELARILHFWLSLYKDLPVFDEKQEAVPNRARDNDGGFYAKTIAECLTESKRTLAPRGRLILTFHNKKMAAWKALCRSLHDAGFAIRAVAAVRAENDADHTKRQGRGLLHDLVLECERKKAHTHKRVIALPSGSPPVQDLLAMGVAMGRALRAGTPENLSTLYEQELRRRSVVESGIR